MRNKIVLTLSRHILPVRFKMKQEETELHSEACQLQKRLLESEKIRLELISINNKEVFELKSELAKLRKMLEISEAVRETLNSELILTKSNWMRDKIILQEKDKALQDANKIIEG